MINIKTNGWRVSATKYNHPTVNRNNNNGLLCITTYKPRKHDTLLCQLTAHMVNTTRIAELREHNCLMTLPVVAQPILRLPIHY